MRDSKRLIDEVDSDLARAVLSSGRYSSGSAARKKQVLTALGVGLVIGTTNKLSMAALSTWQKVVFIGGVACVGAGGALTYTHFAADEAATSQPAVVKNGPTLADVEAPVDALPALPAVPVTEAVPVLEAVSVDTMPTTPPVTQASARGYERVSRESSVKGELGLLEQARRSLNSGSPTGALQALARYRDRYPRGSMRLESEMLKVEALAASGRSQEASRLADRLLARNPKSVVASRLRRFASKD